jgi:hypothetical protein
MLVVVWLLGRPVGAPSASINAQEYPATNTSAPATPYPGSDEEERRTNTPRPTDGTSQPEDEDADTDKDEDASPSPSPDQDAELPRTPTSRRTIQQAEETSTPSPSSTATARRLPTSEPATVPTPTGPPTNTPEPDTLTCLPGETTFIEGIGPPNMPLLLFFADRPVGGATSNDEGFYRIPLRLRNERLDENYIVEVRERSSRRLVRRLTCEVPTPTPGLLPDS